MYKSPTSLLTLILLMGSSLVWGQDDAGSVEDPDVAVESPAEPTSETTYQPTTTLDPGIPTDQLEILVKPLTKSELEVEADAWMDLLRLKAKQIASMQLRVKKANKVLEQNKAELESDTDAVTPTPAQNSDDPSEDVSTRKQDLLTAINDRQDERTAIADRMEIVLVSLETKGGDVEEYREYAVAVSGIQIDTKDASATWAAITGWLSSKEGGQRWAWNLFLFFLILFITYIVAKIVSAIVRWLLDRKLKLTQLAESLIARSVKNVILLIGLAIALTALEVDITPIIAAIGAAGFIIGFALQGTLSNFASGLMILINRPFDVGDVVTAGGVTGTINQMNLVSTTFRTFDNQTIHVPNNEIWGNVITNITANDKRRVDLEFGIGYEDDFENAEQIIQQVVSQHELVLSDPEPQIVTHELADSCVKIVCRPWARTSDWWKVKTDITRQVKREFDQAGISIPYPQRDVHVYQHTSPNSA